MSTLLTLLGPLAGAPIVTNGEPSGTTGASGGLALPTSDRYVVDRALLSINATCTPTTGTFTGRLWVYLRGHAAWFPLGTGATAAAKGLLNEGAAMVETATGVIRHVEEIGGLLRVERIYLQLPAPTAILTLTAYLDIVPCNPTTGG